jgi:hypothetical protein
MNNGAVTPTTQKTVFLPDCNLISFGYENACGLVSNIMTHKMTCILMAYTVAVMEHCPTHDFKSEN